MTIFLADAKLAGVMNEAAAKSKTVAKSKAAAKSDAAGKSDETVTSGAAVKTGRARRRRTPAKQRREELISAAVHEFALGGLHGTPVERIARRVGVAQPYVFSLFASKRELFLAALERSFQRVADTFQSAAAEYAAGRAPAECKSVLEAMGYAYRRKPPSSSRRRPRSSAAAGASSPGRSR